MKKNRESNLLASFDITWPQSQEKEGNNNGMHAFIKAISPLPDFARYIAKNKNV